MQYQKMYDNKIMMKVTKKTDNNWVKSKWSAGYPTSIVLLLIIFFPYC